MKLHVRRWGAGERTALLMHGITSDSVTWDEVGNALAERGYSVLAPDYRGHGLSPRAQSYGIDEFCDDVLENVPSRVEVALGNSLGGWILAKIVDRLRPAHAVYEDPAWSISGEHHALVEAEIRANLAQDAAAVAAAHPLYTAADVQRVVEARSRFDPMVLRDLLSGSTYDARPRAAVVPSLAIAADPPDLISPSVAAELRSAGFDVAVVPGAGHVAHRDDLAGTMELLDRWLAKPPDGERWFPEEWARRYGGDPGLWQRTANARPS